MTAMTVGGIYSELGARLGGFAQAKRLYTQGLTSMAAAADATSAKASKAMASLGLSARSAGQAVAGLGSRLSSIPGVAGLATAGGLVALGAAAVNMTVGVIKASDDLGDLAERLGASTEGLSRLQYTAGLVGADVGALSSSLSYLNRIIGDAEGGSKAANEALARLGLSASQLAGQDVARSFVTVADAISRMPSVSDRAAAAMDVFGRSGQQLLGMLSLNKSAMQAFALQADILGATVSGAVAGQANDASNAMDRMATATAALKRTAVALAPAVAYVADTITGLVAVFNMPTLEGSKNGGGFLSGVLGWLGDNSLLVQKIKALAGVGSEIAKITQGTPKVRGLGQGAEDAGAGGAAVDTAAAARMSEIGRIAGGVATQLREFGMSETDRAVAQLKGLDASKEAIKAFTEQAAALEVLRDAAASVTAANPIESYLAGMDRLRQALAIGAITQEQFAAGAGAVDRALSAAYGDQAAKRGEIIGSLAEKVAAWGRSEGDLAAETLRRLGASDAEIERARGLADAYDRLNSLDSIGAGKSPLEAYAAKMEVVNDLMARGLITAEQYQKAFDQAAKTRDAAMAGETVPATVAATVDRQFTAKAAEVGSADAAGLMADWFNRRDAGGEDQLAEAKKQTQLLGQIAQKPSGGIATYGGL